VGDVGDVRDVRDVDGVDVGAGPTVSAAAVRAATGVSAHQLGELTRLLDLPVGPRPNYPRYGGAAVRAVRAVMLLREGKVPLEDAARAVRTSGLGATGAPAGFCLLAPPTGGDGAWSVAWVVSAGDVAGWVERSSGALVVVSSAAVAAHARAAWAQAAETDGAPGAG
jgi:hypothetical protein